MIVYLDSSLILSIDLKEPDRHPVVSNEVLRVTSSIASPLAYVEVRAGLARARYIENPPRITARSYTRALTEFADDWQRYGLVPVTDDLLSRAGALAERHRLRAYDATHLASAIAAQDDLNERILVSTWDRELAAAAEAEGLSLAHEVTT